MSTSQIAKKAALTPQGVRTIVGSLQTIGLVTRHGATRSSVFAIEMAHPMAGPLLQLFDREDQRWNGLLEEIVSVLKRSEPIRAAWL